MAESSFQRIETLESLRGLLALWVLVGHCLRYSGVTPSFLGPLTHPDLAVDVFVILSGFVISHLLARDARYWPFIVRRFFRLAPLFYFVLIVSAFALNFELAILRAIPHPSEAVTTSIQIFSAARKWFIPDFLVHLTMLHGIIPIPQGSYAIVGQAWSISLEWQFYLLAPLILSSLFAKRWHVATTIFILAAALHLLHFQGPPFIANQAHLFAIGIASSFLWRKVRLDGKAADMAAIGVALLAYVLVQRWVAIALWSVVLANLLTKEEAASGMQGVIGKILLWSPLRWLGRISYSIYMTHMLVVIFAIYCLSKLAPGIEENWMLAMLLITASVSLVLPISWMTYSLIEAPGIALGRKLANGLRPEPLDQAARATT